MERETKIVQIDGHDVVMKAYITARESMAAEKAAKGKGEEELAKLTLEAIVVTFDGSAENIYDRIIDQPVATFTKIAEEVANIANPTKPGNSNLPGGDTSEPAA